MPIGSPQRLVLAALTLAALLPLPSPAPADEGDPAGWSVVVDPRKRAFLRYVAEAGGPRLLHIGCLRDVDEFFVAATGVEGLPDDGPGSGLTLTVPDADYVIYGNIAMDDEGRPAFNAEVDADARALKKIAAELLPVLTAPGPVVLQVDNGEPVDLTLEDLPPRAGIAKPLATFRKVCFGGK